VLHGHVLEVSNSLPFLYQSNGLEEQRAPSSSLSPLFGVQDCLPKLFLRQQNDRAAPELSDWVRLLLLSEDTESSTHLLLVCYGFEESASSEVDHALERTPLQTMGRLTERLLHSAPKEAKFCALDLMIRRLVENVGHDQW
jgi:hypothetical protein